MWFYVHAMEGNGDQCCPVANVFPKSLILGSADEKRHAGLD